MRCLSKSYKLILGGILFLSLLVGCGGGGGGGSSSGGETVSTPASLEIKAPMSDPPVILGSQQTIITISAYVPGSTVELFRIDGSNLTKIGDMTDDGTNGDQTAGDKVYTIQITVNESSASNIIFRISASSNNTQSTRDISISVAQVPSLTSDAEFNQAAEELYTKAMETRSLFINFDQAPLTALHDIGNNLLEMFSKFEAITKQDVGYDLFKIGKGINSCDELLAAFRENPNDPRFSEFRKTMANAIGDSEDIFNDPYFKEAAFLSASKYLQVAKIKPTFGCEGGHIQEVGNFAFKALLSQWTSLAAEGIGQLFNLGTLSVKLINEGGGVLIGWFIDENGNENITVGKTTDNETFDTPVGTHNLIYSFGSSTPKAVVKNISIVPQQTTAVTFAPGTITGGYSLAGTVSSGGIGLAEVSIKLTGPETASVITNSNGQYSFTNLANGSYIVTPSKIGYTFTPSSRSITVNNANITGQDFVGTAVTNATTWARTYGENNSDVSYSVEPTSDGGYIVSGTKTTLFGNAYGIEMRILKLNNNGDIQWQKIYGENYSYNEIQQTSDGGYITVASIYSIRILKLAANGNVEWQKNYSVNNYGSVSIQRTSDGGYIVGGTTSSFGAGNYDIWIMKLDANGNIQWQKAFGTSDGEYAKSIRQTLDGGYIVAGYRNLWKDALVLKLDANGNIQWQKSYLKSEDEIFNSIQQTSDGGYIMAGTIDSYNWPFSDAWVVKVDGNGNIQWQKRYNEVNFSAGTYYIQQTLDGGYIMTGWTGEKQTFGSYINGWIVKLNDNGNIQWQKTYGGTLPDQLRNIRQTLDKGYIVSGTTSSFGVGNNDIWIMKLDANGDVGSSCAIVGTSNSTEIDTDVSPVNISLTVTATNATVTTTTVTPQDSNATTTTQCSAP